MFWHKLEGIVLAINRFQEKKNLITLWNGDQGLVKIVLNRLPKGEYIDVLMTVEVVCRPGHGELWNSYEFTVRDYGLKYRSDLAYLQAAGGIVSTLLTSQTVQRPAPQLYILSQIYLNALVTSPTIAASLLASFRLKTLYHEGLYPLFEEKCRTCLAPLDILFIQQGESVCRAHADSTALTFDAEEIRWLNTLTFCRRFDHMPSYCLPLLFLQKVERLFHSSFAC